METDYSRRIDKLRTKEKTLTEELVTKSKMFEEKTRGWEASAKSRLELIEMKESALNR